MSTSNHENKPDARSIRRRIFILREIILKAFATPPAKTIAQWMKSWDESGRTEFVFKFGDMFAIREHQIRSAGLWEDMTEEERAFIQAGVLETTDQHRIDASRLPEAIVCFLWALGRLEKLPSYDQETGHDLIETETGQEALANLKQAAVRPTEELQCQRDFAELWHWRCRTRRLIESGQLSPALPNGMSLEKVIEMAALKAAEEGAFASPIGNDFPALGKPFRDITAEEFASVTSISQERHKALNWLCGYADGNRWDATPTDT
jgi:hypothetical protein